MSTIRVHVPEMSTGGDVQYRCQNCGKDSTVNHVNTVHAHYIDVELKTDETEAVRGEDGRIEKTRKIPSSGVIVGVWADEELMRPKAASWLPQGPLDRTSPHVEHHREPHTVA